MEKFIAFYKLYLSEILFACVSVLTLSAILYGVICNHESLSVSERGWLSIGIIVGATIVQIVLGAIIRSIFKPQTKISVWTIYYSLSAILIAIGAYIADNYFVGFVGIAWNVYLMTFLRPDMKKDEINGPFLVPSASYFADTYDPMPEPADKLPYVYYDQPIEQKAYIIHYYSPYLGIEKAVLFNPRKQRGKPFDNVGGIIVADNLVLLRSILFTSNFPGDIREMAKQYKGRLPNEAEIEQIYAKFKEINQNLYECGEPLLRRWNYLYTSGDEQADRQYNYCLNFANGQKTFEDCDNYVCAVLVERLPLDAEQLNAYKMKYLHQKFGDEFDVLCEVDGKNVRLPFSKRHLGNPIGIFPFKNEAEYLELDEVENKKHTDKDVDKSRLLDERFCCDCVSKVVDRLNLYLKEMNKPLLDGSYLADSSYMKGCGWIIGFDNTSDYYGGNVPAKLRYMGRFYGSVKK